MKKLVLASMVPIALSTIFLSCGTDENSPEACSFAVSQAIDKGDYDTAIAKLEANPTCGGAYTEVEGKLQLAAAYIGKAGFDIPTLINDIATIDDNNNSEYQLLVKVMARKLENNSIEYITKAKKLYKELVQDCNKPNLEPILKDVCFYRTLVDTVESTAALTLTMGTLTNGEDLETAVKKWTDPEVCDDLNNNNVGDNADATASAIEYAASGKCTTTNVSCNVPSTITFNKNGNQYDFKLLKIDVSKVATNGCTSKTVNTEYRLLTKDKNGNDIVAITNGLCDTNLNKCDNLDPNNGCYPCPVIVDDNPLDMTETIVETLNNIDDVANIVGADATVSQDLENLQQDICGTDGCSSQDIQNYLLNN